MIRVGINGFGRIGKSLSKILLETDGVELITINDLAPVATQAHLFKYDSIHGRFSGNVSFDENNLVVNGQSIRYTSQAEISELSWTGIDILIECTGRFTRKEDAAMHLENGAGKVIISAPSPSDDVKTILVGINEDILEASDRIVSNASCTTNSAGPLIKILDEHCGLESAYITTVHSYTGDQRLHDSPHPDLRRARAAAESIIPTTTGAAKAITKIFTHLDGKIGGCGIRVPVPNGSLTDLSCVVKDPMPTEKLNALFQSFAEGSMKGILEYSEAPLVSKDIISNTHSCVFDAPLTSVIGKMVKIVGWYDNETGYTNRLRDLIILMDQAD